MDPDFFLAKDTTKKTFFKLGKTNQAKASNVGICQPRLGTKKRLSSLEIFHVQVRPCLIGFKK